jgi:trigger factor
MYKVSDEEIDIQLKMLQKNLTRHVPVAENRPAVDGDFVLVTYEGFKDGEPFDETKKTENFTMKIGAETIHEAIDKGLMGMDPGEEKKIPVRFPDDHANSKLKGLDIEFQVTLNEIRKEEIPEIDDEMAKKLGPFETLEDLKNKIIKNLTQGYEKRTEQEMNEQIFKALIGKTEFEVPDTMVEYELQSILTDAERSFAYHNTSMEDLGMTREGLSEKYRDTAVKQVRRYLILDKIIQQEGLELADEDLEKGYEEMAENYNQSIDNIKEFYKQNPDKVDVFKHVLLEKQAIKLIIESSTIEEVEPKAEGETQNAEDTEGAESEKK